MKKIVLLLIICGLFVSDAMAQKPRLREKIQIKKRSSTEKEVKGNIFSPEDLLSLNRVSGMALSPDGKWIVYQIGKPSIEDNKIYTDLYAVSIDGGEEHQLTTHEEADYGAVWSPDGDMIAFISTRDGSPQIYKMDFPDGKPKRMTDMPNGIGHLSWSPDGDYFAFTSDVKAGKNIHDKYPRLDEAHARIYTDIPVRHWDEWNDEKYRHLFIMPADGGDPVDLMKNQKYETPMKPFGGSGDIAWAADGSEIAYTAKKVKDYAESTDSDIYVVNIESKKTTCITDGMDGFDMHPGYSPDGRWIAFHSMKRPGFEADRIRLMLYDRESGATKELPEKLDQWVGQYVWTPDSREIYFSSGTEGKVPIFRVGLANGRWKQITEGRYNYDYGLDITPDGKTLVYGKRNMMRPPEIFSYDIQNNTETQLTHANDKKYEDLAPVDIEEEWFKTADGKMLHTWVLFPPGFDREKKYPMITYCQGGPQSTISNYFSFRWNLYLMASQGYVVVAPNRRGMPGFGQAWNDAISGDWGGKPMRDILLATDNFSQRKYIDSNRISAVGASAGGYAAFWLAGNHEGRFSAFISHCGVFNLVSMYGSTEELWFPNWEYGGPYWKKENKKFYDEHSPHMYADNWDTPIMISTGEYDFRVPFTQSLEAYTVAQVKGIPSKLVIFPEENHWILSLHNALLWQHEFFGFLEKYCKEK